MCLFLHKISVKQTEKIFKTTNKTIIITTMNDYNYLVKQLLKHHRLLVEKILAKARSSALSRISFKYSGVTERLCTLQIRNTVDKMKKHMNI